MANNNANEHLYWVCFFNFNYDYLSLVILKFFESSENLKQTQQNITGMRFLLNSNILKVDSF